jgi:hypothetical protein
MIDVRAFDDGEHPPGRQARAFAAGAALRLEPLEDLAPPVIVDRLLQRDDVEAREARGDRLGARGDIGLVPGPLAQHATDKRQIGGDELDVVGRDAQRAARGRLEPGVGMAGAAEPHQAGGHHQGRMDEPVEVRDELLGHRRRCHRAHESED